MKKTLSRKSRVRLPLKPRLGSLPGFESSVPAPGTSRLGHSISLLYLYRACCDLGDFHTRVERWDNSGWRPWHYPCVYWGNVASPCRGRLLLRVKQTEAPGWGVHTWSNQSVRGWPGQIWSHPRQQRMDPSWGGRLSPKSHGRIQWAHKV